MTDKIPKPSSKPIVLFEDFNRSLEASPKLLPEIRAKKILPASKKYALAEQDTPDPVVINLQSYLDFDIS